jgi:hypothetical protein
VRTVKVALEADVAGFKTGVDSAKHSVNELDDKVDKLDHDLEKIPPDALKAAAAVKALGEGARGAGDQLKTIGDKTAGLAVLDAKLAESRSEVKKLAEEFIKTGDMDVFQQLGRATANHKVLTDIRKDLAKSIEGGADDGTKRAGNIFTRFFGTLAGGAVTAGKFAGDAFTDGIGSAFKALPPELKAGLIAGLAVAALAAVPVIVSAIDAALLLAIGGIGLAGAIAVAVQDANVSKVFSDLGGHIMTTLGRAVTPLRSELVGAAIMFGESFDKITPNINRMANTLSKAIQPIAAGLSGLFQNAAPGIEKAFQGALPLLRDFGDWLPKLGSEVGNLGEALARAEPEAELFFKFLLANVDVAIKSVTFLTDGVHAVVGAMMSWVGQYQPLSPALADDKTAMNDLANAATSVADDVKSIGDAFTAMGQSVEGALTSKILDSMFALDDATLKWHESLNKLNDKIDKNGTSLDVNTDKGIKNAKMLEQAAKANADLYQQNLLSGMGADQAAAAYEKNADQLRRQAIQAGFNAHEVDNLIGKYRNVPAKVQTILATIGLTNALDHLAQILVDFRSLNDKEFKTKYTVTTEYKVVHTGTSGGKEGPGKYAQGGIRRAAEGLIVAPSDPGSVLFGEPQTGGEALIPLRGITQDRAYELTQTVASNYGMSVSRGDSARAGVTVNFAGDTSGAFASAFMGLVRTGVIQIGSS